MPEPEQPQTNSPAERAARAAQTKINSCIDERRNFLAEAGAGAGKTESLVLALKHILSTSGRQLARKRQTIACITFTNVAAKQIESRIDNHPGARISTIHSFCWSLISNFQIALRAQLPGIGGWTERLQQADVAAAGRQITYDELGRRVITETTIAIHHDDVLGLTIKLLDHRKFRDILTSRHPIILIDEYQDTNTELIAALLKHFVEPSTGPQFGFFGDEWQKIYGHGCGAIAATGLTRIPQLSNFRSAPPIVACLNRIRPQLPQEPSDPSAIGSVRIFHTNRWSGIRQTGQHWGGDLPPEEAHRARTLASEQLHTEGWNMAPPCTKILMLTHKVLASEQGYSGIAGVFEFADAYIRKEDPHIAFLCDFVEPACLAYQRRRFGEMFEILGATAPPIRGLNDKNAWAKSMDKLLQVRETGTIGDALDHLRQSRRPALSEAVLRREAEISAPCPTDPEEIERHHRREQRLKKLRPLPYREVSSLYKFIEDETPFATKHGVKGEEFENVMGVFGRGWNQYDWGKFLELAANGATIPADQQEFFVRNRNLFYVVCSRPKRRLTLLFTQQLSDAALGTLNFWFGDDALRSLY